MSKHKTTKAIEQEIERRRVIRQILVEKMSSCKPSEKETFPFTHSLLTNYGWETGIYYFGEDAWMDECAKYSKAKQMRLVPLEEIRDMVDSFIGNYLLDDSYPRLDVENRQIFMDYNAYEEDPPGPVQGFTAVALMEELGVAYRVEDWLEKSDMPKFLIFYKKLKG